MGAQLGQPSLMGGGQQVSLRAAFFLTHLKRRWAPTVPVVTRPIQDLIIWAQSWTRMRTYYKPMIQANRLFLVALCRQRFTFPCPPPPC